MSENTCSETQGEDAPQSQSYTDFLEYFSNTVKPKTQLDQTCRNSEIAQMAAPRPIKVELTVDRVNADEIRIIAKSNVLPEEMRAMFKVVRPFVDAMFEDRL